MLVAAVLIISATGLVALVGAPHLVAVAGVLLVLNVIPGVRLGEMPTQIVTMKWEDVSFVLLAVAAASAAIDGGYAPSNRLQRALVLWACALSAYWLIEYVRSVVGGVPPGLAAQYCRDFLIFAIATPLAALALRSRRAVYAAGAMVVTVTTVYSAAYVGAVLGALPPTVANATTVADVGGGLTRVLTLTRPLMAATFFFSLAFAATQKGKAAWTMGAVSAVNGVALILGLTRAVYLAVALALIATAVAWFARSGTEMRRLRRRLIVGVATIIGSMGLMIAMAPGFWATTQADAVRGRLSESVTVLTDRSGTASATVNARIEIVRRYEHRLAGNWMFGLGFKHPEHSYDADLPNGSIRSSDVGVFNQLMTIGLVGAVLFHLPFLMLIAASLAMAPRAESAWFWMGALGWSVYVLASLPSLGIVNQPWALLAALIFGAAARMYRDRRPTSAVVGVGP